MSGRKPRNQGLVGLLFRIIRPYIEKYQGERVTSGAPQEVNTTAEVVNFVEILLGHLSDMDANEVSLR